ncbi:MAG: hypothetical protein WAM85_01985 [Terracidiphilus sp.]
MEIGPITGIRAVNLLAVKRPGSADFPVFEIDPSARPDDETYSSSSQTPHRGLEEEDSASPTEDDLEPETPSLQATPDSNISFFA